MKKTELIGPKSDPGAGKDGQKKSKVVSDTNTKKLVGGIANKDKEKKPDGGVGAGGDF